MSVQVLPQSGVQYLAVGEEIHLIELDPAALTEPHYASRIRHPIRSRLKPDKQTH